MNTTRAPVVVRQNRLLCWPAAVLLILITNGVLTQTWAGAPLSHDSDRSEEAKADVEKGSELRAFIPPKRVNPVSATRGIKLLLIAPVLVFLALIIALLIKPKEAFSIYRKPSALPRKNRTAGENGSEGSSGYNINDSDSTYY
jgi:hypothetical protein